jgi:hypothetical protein
VLVRFSLSLRFDDSRFQEGNSLCRVSRGTPIRLFLRSGEWEDNREYRDGHSTQPHRGKSTDIGPEPVVIS